MPECKLYSGIPEVKVVPHRTVLSQRENQQDDLGEYLSRLGRGCGAGGLVERGSQEDS